MSQRERVSRIAFHLREDVVDALAETVTDVLAQLSPATRLRVVAFLHLIEQPEAVLANLEVDSSGLLTLTLANGANQKH